MMIEVYRMSTTGERLKAPRRLSACIVKGEVGKCMTKGSHGSTFGGNALCCCCGNACINELSKQQFLSNVEKMGQYFMTELEKIIANFPNILKSVSGLGLMLGVSVDNKIEAKKVAEKLLENGLSCCTAGGNQIRFLPPLIIKKKHIDEAIKIIEKTIIGLI